MAVSNVSEMGGRWASKVANKQGKFASRFRESRGAVLEGLRRIGANPGPSYSQAVQSATPNEAAWAAKVLSPGAQARYQQNWLEAISR